MNEERFYLSLLGESYENRGVRLNDKLYLSPGVGRKREVKLNRFRYEFSTDSSPSFEINNGVIKLPKVAQEDFKFEMVLSKSTLDNKNEERLRYLLRSKSNTPFRINDSLSYESFIERGDVVTLGYNKLKFDYYQSGGVEKQYICPIDHKLVESDLNILIEGETGTGKSTLAKNIHDSSLRSGRFIQLNLSTFSSSLIESELFGHAKGSFTGAIREKVGALEIAHRGTLFLDEIDSLSIDLQVKLLLFLDNSLVRKVGDNTERKVDVRLILATGTPLKERIKSEKMRKDFFFRISSGIKVKLKPLRENKILLRSIIEKYSLNSSIYFDEKLIIFYLSLSWPGNIRQLIGHLDKKRVLSSSMRISFDELDEELSSDTLEICCAVEDVITLKKLKIEYAQRILLKFDGNLKVASSAIGITPKTMKSLTSIQL